MSRQLDINVPEPAAKRRSLTETVAEVLARFGPRKQEVLARQLDASPSHLSEVIKGHKHWPDKWLDYVAEHYDFECAIADHFAQLRGCVVRPPRKRSAAEELRRLRYTLQKHNALGKALQAEADALADDVFADDDGEPKR